MILFLFLVFLIWGALLGHVFYRTQSLLGLKRKILLWLAPPFFLVGFLYIPARIFLHKGLGQEFAAPLVYAGAWAAGILCIVWTLLVALEVFSGILSLAAGRSVWAASGPKRRISAGILWGLSLILALAGFYNARSTPSITRLQVTVPQAARQSLAVIADAHLGAIASESQWRRTLEAARTLDPDALLIPGDLVDDSGKRAGTQAAMLREFFPESPIYVTTGNHEFYTGVGLFSELCRKFDLTLLRQEVASLCPALSLAGIDDSHFMKPQKALARVLKKAKGPLLLLTHRPAAAHLLKDRPMSLALAGHTHGGQTIPMVFIAALGNGGFRSGLYEVGEARLYVSNGTGVWGPPVRLCAPPELLLIEVLPGSPFRVSTLPP